MHHIDINQAIAICTRNGITVTSEPVGKKFAVKVEDNGDVKIFKKTVYAHRINAAIKKTWRAYAAQLINKERSNNA